MSQDHTVPHRRTAVPVKSLRVEVVQGPDEGKSARASTNQISVGTSNDNDLVLTDDTVSRYHLELAHVGDGILVQDLGSTNGTVVGTLHVKQATAAPGTILTIGRTRVRVEDGKTINLELFDEDTLGNLRGRSPEMRKLMATVKRVAMSDVSVLLIGETGCGKELIAEAVHLNSARASQPFEIVDCASLSPMLVASELFGHERGAFTSADRQHIGAFERANGGTLFLDEIGELPANLQTMLLGALERGSFRRVGGQDQIHVDVRVVCATNRDLREEVNAGTFRQDLYYRVAVVLLRVPPLRDRVEDIPLLVEHFLREAGFSGAVDEIVPANAMDGLKQHRWPGNVRELRNFVDAAMAMGEAPDLQHTSTASGAASHDDFPTMPIGQLLELSYKDARGVVLGEFEKLYLVRLLERCGNNVSKAARTSQIHRSYLNQMLKRHRLR